MMYFALLALSLLFPPPATVTITETVVQKVYVTQELRFFRDGEEICQYLDGRPVWMATTGQDCDDLARFFVQDARRYGLDVSLQYLSSWRGGPHMLVMALCPESNAIYYIEPSTNEYWWVSVID